MADHLLFGKIGVVKNDVFYLIAQVQLAEK